MPKAKTTQEKEKFVQDNLNLVPVKSKNVFGDWDIDKQYKMMTTYVRKAGKSTSTRFNVKSAIKFITSKNPTPAQVKKVVDGLEEWVNNTTKREIEEIDKQIAELNKKKATLSK